MTLSYKEELLHPNWQRRRLEIMNRDEFTCRSCGDDDSTLHVHHKHYIKGRMAWDYSDDELLTLCEPCHAVSHEESEGWKLLLAKLSVDGPGSKAEAYALLAGWATHSTGHDLSAIYQRSPWMYLAGEVAALIEESVPNVEWLLTLRDALSTSPIDRRSEVLAAAARALIQDEWSSSE